MAITLNLPSNIRLLVMCTAMCIGGYIGQLSIWSEIFSTPIALDKPWHVTSALRKQGSDRLEPATHLHQGGLRLLAYRSVTADQAQLNMNMDRFALSVIPQSNLRISVGNQNPYNIKIQNGLLKISNDINIDMTTVQNFVFQDNFIYVEHQNQLMRLGRSNGTEIRFSSFDTMAEINYLSCSLEEQSLLEIQKNSEFQYHFLYIGIVLGALIGYFLHASHLIAIAILLFSLHSQLYFWFQLQEKLSLTSIKPWVFRQSVTLISIVPILFSLYSQVPFQIKSRRIAGNHFVYLWLLTAILFLGTHIHQPMDIIWIVYIFLPISLPLRTPFRNQWWYAYDLVSIAVLFIPHIGFLLSLFCRWAVLLQNLRILRRWNARAVLDIAFIYMLCLPIGLEMLLPTPQIMIDNTPSEWKRASASFQASCGTEEKEFRILYAGGSSAGGAYQLQGSAFFAQYVHQALCEKGYSINTRNIGGAARNSYTIAESMNVWKQFEPNLVIFYGGVNDTLDKRYTQSRREREDALKMSRSIGLLRLGSQSDTIQILARLLSQQNQERVSEVSITEARYNLLQMASLPKSKTLLLTEWVRAPLKKEIQGYEDLQKELALQNSNIYHLNLREKLSDKEIDQLLIDANHPSERGHLKIANIIQKWLTENIITSKKQ